MIAVGSNDKITDSLRTRTSSDQGDTASRTFVTRVVIYGKEDSEGRPAIEAVLDGKTEYGVLQSIQSVGSSDISEAKKGLGCA